MKTVFEQITELSKTIHAGNVDRGFYDNPETTAGILCLVHSELSEALESDRKSHNTQSSLSDVEKIENLEAFKNVFESEVKNTFEDELADAAIRILDLCAYKGIDIGKHISLKLKYNATRPYKHGKKY